MAEKLTQECFLKRSYEKKPMLEILSEYDGMNKTIKVKCRVCDKVFEKNPSNILYNKSGCPFCANNIKKTTPQYREELQSLHSNLDFKGEYSNTHTQLLHFCNICGSEFLKTPDSVLRSKHGCQQCYYDDKMQNERNSKYLLKLREINPQIQALEDYSGYATKIKHHCSRHGVEWYTSPKYTLRGKGCSQCKLEKTGNKKRMAKNDYEVKLRAVNPNIILVGERVSTNKKCLHKCLVCGTQWEALGNNLLRGEGCPRCGREKLSAVKRLSEEEYDIRLNKAHPHIKRIDRYVNALTPIKHHCLKCGLIFEINPPTIVKGHGCPTCEPYYSSVGEQRVADYLISHNIAYHPQFSFEECKYVNLLRFDFYLPDLDLCIEYQGELHYNPMPGAYGITDENAQGVFELIKTKDEVKRKFCKENNISLLEIHHSKKENMAEFLDDILPSFFMPKNNLKEVKE